MSLHMQACPYLGSYVLLTAVTKINVLLCKACTGYYVNMQEGPYREIKIISLYSPELFAETGPC